MAGFCKDLFSLILFVGFVLNVLLGVFTLIGNVTLEEYANKMKTKGIFNSKRTRVAAEFFTSGCILLLLYLLIYLKQKFGGKKNHPNIISYQMSPDNKNKQLKSKEQKGDDFNLDNFNINFNSSLVSSESRLNAVN